MFVLITAPVKPVEFKYPSPTESDELEGFTFVGVAQFPPQEPAEGEEVTEGVIIAVYCKEM